ncbi:thiamine pyrophosphate-binding protein [Thermogemmatispora tikiterensis]|jgi:sulfopyruvate decarboxylase subunit alpha|uniref:Sulfopyruvate decarboxylase n=1 Tax=Thermogemmatispora tikiterensis TaxID=1825093 RepID=A0A328VMR8_9CHLR|nr:thiamine pyrophosphate-binding protein [Thermogemmatispora tikiterensis]RAQ97120.1 sulfopyruvate decarboxylase [Thermogemmatispora tikiterensis]
MPVSLEGARRIYEALKACDIRLVSALPETWLVPLLRLVEADQEMRLVQVAREEESIGIAAGAYFAGLPSIHVMQNHGFLAAINPLVSLAMLYKIPVLLLISYRGSWGERDPWQTQGGLLTEPVLRALTIPYYCLRREDDLTRRLKEAQALALSALHPVAVLLTREVLWEDEEP